MNPFFLMLLSLLTLLVACDSDDQVTCEPSCDQAICGDDGCGGSCGSCENGQVCANGTCTSVGCGDGVLAESETCDDSAGEACTPPSYCESNNACFVATYTGGVTTCDATCTTQLIETCVSGDGCCPNGCNPENDLDCRPASCGNGLLDAEETCDAPEFPCPDACPNTDACLTVILTGLAEACNAACTTVPITACYPNSDGCCPQDCETQEDADCAALVCGNAQLDPGELCDSAIIWPNPGACSPDCNDHRACTMDALAGNPQTCSVMCANVVMDACQSGDGCCPPNCTVANDTDCANVTCGDGVVDGDEYCDNLLATGLPGYCLTTLGQCDDQDPCTVDSLVGSPDDCSARCVNEPLPCGGGDSCCPATCNSTNDTECSALNLCADYCDKALTYCTGANTLYDSTTDCLAACQPMPIGTPADATGATLYCRIHHLIEAMADPDTHCFHASAVPTEACID